MKRIRVEAPAAITGRIQTDVIAMWTSVWNKSTSKCLGEKAVDAQFLELGPRLDLAHQGGRSQSRAGSARGCASITAAAAGKKPLVASRRRNVRR